MKNFLKRRKKVKRKVDSVQAGSRSTRAVEGERGKGRAVKMKEGIGKTEGIDKVVKRVTDLVIEVSTCVLSD